MTTNNPHISTLAHLKDMLAFGVTVAACTIFLSAGWSFSRATQLVAETAPALSMPTPPTPLFPVFETVCLLPEILADAIDPGTILNSSSESIFPSFEPDAIFVAEVDSTPHHTIVSTTSSISEAAVGDEPTPFHGIITQVAGRYEVDPHLIRAIIFAESGYNPRAKSKKGARGLMQLMPSTAKALGVQDIFDPEENIDGGVRYFRSLLDRFDGDVQLALAAYNAGSRHVRNYEGIPPFKATQRYIKKVLKFHKKFKMEKMAISRRLV
ncbi:MAG: lytic transglycosylase domain-containing protein [Desulfosarcina sp.]